MLTDARRITAPATKKDNDIPNDLTLFLMKTRLAMGTNSTPAMIDSVLESVPGTASYPISSIISTANESR
jgi:hypothetical protein